MPKIRLIVWPGCMQRIFGFSLLVGVIGVIGDSRELEIIGVMDVPSADSVVSMGVIGVPVGTGVL